MARKVVVQKPVTLDPDRTLRALTQQVGGLQKLKGRQYQDAGPEETEWTHFTQSYLEAAFGNPSPTLERFYMAGSAGGLILGRMSPQQYQSKFETRVREYEALLQSLIAVARLQLPDEEIKGVYGPGEQYDFYRDLSSLIVTTTKEIFIVDAYLDEEVFNLYVDKVPGSATVRILSANKIGPNVATVAKMYVKSRPLELRSSADIHDRTVFFDQRGWVIGQSIKDAARKKPTYLIELDEPLLNAARNIYDSIWAAARIVNLV
jgi:hypothetical protein